MGREGRRAGSNNPKGEEDRESSTDDPETPESTDEEVASPGTSQTTFENGSDSADSSQEATKYQLDPRGSHVEKQASFNMNTNPVPVVFMFTAGGRRRSAG